MNNILSTGSPESRIIALRLLALGAIGLVIGNFADAFVSSGNLLNILRQASLLFLVASGLTIVIIAGGLDLSIGANVSLSACLAATIIQSTGSLLAGAAVALCSGLAIGAVNAFVICVLRVPAFIATYGMLWIIQGIAYWYMSGATIHGFSSEVRYIGSGFAAGIPIPVYIMLAFLLLGTVFTRRTTWGQQIYAIGANSTAAGLSGIPVNRRVALVYVISGAMAGLAALVFLARLNSAEADIGDSLMLQAVAAVLIGGTSLFGGLGTLTGTLLGCIVLAVVLNGMNLLSISASWQPIVTGVIVIASVLFDALGRRHR